MNRFILASSIALLCAAGAKAGQPGETNEPVAYSVTTSAASSSSSADKEGWRKYMPDVHGVLRPRFEMDTEDGKGRFAMRHARISLGGDIGPFAYFFNTDFCDQGKIKALDYWVGAHATRDLYFQIGQFRMPFGVEPFLGPANSYFANRSFIGKQVCNVRAVGAKVSWGIPGVPLTVEGGMFNPTAITDHTIWTGKFAYAGRAVWKPGDFSVSGGFMSIRPDGVRMNLADAALGWKHDRWTVAGEYMYKHYTHESHKGVHAWAVFGDYHFPVKFGVFNRMSAQVRWDGMTDHSSGTRVVDENGVAGLITDDPARNRLTAGLTLSYIRTKNMYVDIRVNYEKYFFHHGVTPEVGQGDKAVLDFVLSF